MLKQEWQRFVNRCVWSWAGIVGTWKTEPSFRFWFALNCVSLAGVILVDMSGGERAVILALGILVLASELANTALENAVDLAQPNFDPIAKLAKDCGSAAVAVTAVAAGVVWVSVLFT